ncbi:hypothetical protein FRC07_013576 [Ceratobasidium sp. 392]|nr:hypothetical protein FRC07_013576 [Ceratobasidium sp. 392]
MSARCARVVEPQLASGCFVAASLSCDNTAAKRNQDAPDLDPSSHDFSLSESATLDLTSDDSSLPPLMSRSRCMEKLVAECKAVPNAGSTDQIDICIDMNKSLCELYAEQEV